MLLQEALDAAWEEKLVRLEAYKAVHGDCNVPLRWAEDPRLGKWVDHQRGRKRKLDRGEPSKGMTAERAARLTALGFVWDPKVERKRGGRRSSRGWRPTRRRTATATCRRAGPRTRGSAGGSTPAGAQAEARPRRAQRGDDGGAGGAADGARLRLGSPVRVGA